MLKQKLRGHRLSLVPGGGIMSNAFWLSGAGMLQPPQIPGGNVPHILLDTFLWLLLLDPEA